MIIIFQMSHFNSIILDDDTLKTEIESCKKDFNDIYSPLNLWINKNKRNLVFYKRYYNSLICEYYYRFNIKLESLETYGKFIKFPEEFWYNNDGVIEKLNFNEISKKYKQYLKNKWEKSSNLKWTKRFNNKKQVLNFIEGVNDDN